MGVIRIVSSRLALAVSWMFLPIAPGPLTDAEPEMPTFAVNDSPDGIRVIFETRVTLALTSHDISGLILVLIAVSYTHLTLPTIYSV